MINPTFEAYKKKLITRIVLNILFFLSPWKDLVEFGGFLTWKSL